MRQVRKVVAGLALIPAAIAALSACGSDGGENGGATTNSAAPPAGACRTGGTATGSFEAACNQCGRERCNAELSDKAGSGWANQYLGGDGACAAFNGCLCECLASGADPLACATTACIAALDAACQAAVQAANDCLNASCATEC